MTNKNWISKIGVTALLTVSTTAAWAELPKQFSVTENQMELWVDHGKTADRFIATFSCALDKTAIRGLPNAYTLDVTNCEPEQIGRELAIAIHNPELSFEGMTLSPTPLNEVLKVLGTDHVGSDGSEAFSRAQLNRIRGLATDQVIYAGEMHTNYRGGSGVGYVVAFVSRDQKQAVVLVKDTYAE